MTRPDIATPPAAPHAIAPQHDDRDGPLPALLVVLTFVTGLVDAVSYPKLGHVFVANMTGNVVFAGFAVAGAQDFPFPRRWPRSRRSWPAALPEDGWPRGPDIVAGAF